MDGRNKISILMESAKCQVWSQLGTIKTACVTQTSNLEKELLKVNILFSFRSKLKIHIMYNNAHAYIIMYMYACTLYIYMYTHTCTHV